MRRKVCPKGDSVPGRILNQNRIQTPLVAVIMHRDYIRYEGQTLELVTPTTMPRP